MIYVKIILNKILVFSFPENLSKEVRSSGENIVLGAFSLFCLRFGDKNRRRRSIKSYSLYTGRQTPSCTFLTLESDKHTLSMVEYWKCLSGGVVDLGGGGCRREVRCLLMGVRLAQYSILAGCTSRQLLVTISFRQRK